MDGADGVAGAGVVGTAGMGVPGKGAAGGGVVSGERAGGGGAGGSATGMGTLPGVVGRVRLSRSERSGTKSGVGVVGVAGKADGGRVTASKSRLSSSFNSPGMLIGAVGLVAIGAAGNAVGWVTPGATGPTGVMEATGVPRRADSSL